jgi:outer membrane immunogenic protein
LGFLATPSLLLYVKGGAAWVRDHFSQNRNVASQGLAVGNYANADVTRSGYVVGAGAEYRFTNNWSVFAEYNYIGLGGTQRTTFISTALSPAGAGTPFTLDVRQDNLQLGLVGVNYRFNWGSPVVARY